MFLDCFRVFRVVRGEKGLWFYFACDSVVMRLVHGIKIQGRKFPDSWCCLSGLTLAEVTRRLGAKSINTYARYEQGRSVPTVTRLSQLLSAAASKMDFVLSESRA